VLFPLPLVPMILIFTVPPAHAEENGSNHNVNNLFTKRQTTRSDTARR
jgi:hypothetical protein